MTDGGTYTSSPIVFTLTVIENLRPIFNPPLTTFYSVEGIKNEETLNPHDPEGFTVIISLAITENASLPPALQISITDYTLKFEP